MFILLFILQLRSDQSMLKHLLLTHTFSLFSLQVLHAIYHYSLQDKLVTYGFLEHDDYQWHFQTFDFTHGHLLVLPFLSYTASVLMVFALTVVVKYAFGWLFFNLFSTILPPYMTYYRRYLYTILALLFMMVFGSGYFMNLYY